MPSLPMLVKWLPHICQDKLKGIETSWGGVRYLSTIKISVDRHSCQEDGAWAAITTEILLVIYFSSLSQSITHMLCKKEHTASWMSSRFSDHFLIQCFSSFPRWDGSLRLLVAYSCRLPVALGSWGLVYKRVQKADGDVRVREGPRRQQQRRCTQQQTASSCCEKFPLILCVKPQTCTAHTYTHT